MQNFIPVTNSQTLEYLAASYLTPGLAQAPVDVVDDAQVSTSIQPVTVNTPGSNPVFSADYETTDTLSIGVGNFDQAPTGGTYSMQIGAQTGGGLATLGATSTAAGLQSIFNAALTTESKPLSVVSLISSGVFLITGATNGAITHDFFQILSADLLFPVSTATINEDTPGSASTPYRLLLQLRQSPMCFATLADELPDADVVATPVQAGSGTANNIQKVSFTIPQVYDGTYTVSAIANSTTATCGTATPLMTANQFGLMLAKHPEINFNTPGVANNVSVTQQGQTWTVEFIGTLGLSASNSISVANVDLVGPKGKSGAVDYNTTTLNLYAATKSGDSFQLTRVIQRTRASGEIRTIYSAPVTIKKSLLNPSTAVPGPSANYLTVAQGDARYLRKDVSSSLASGSTLTVASGATVAIASGATLSVNGSFSGTATGGTLDLSAVTLGQIVITKTTEQLRLRYDSGNYASVTVSSSGSVIMDSVGIGAKYALYVAGVEQMRVDANITRLIGALQQFQIPGDGSNFDANKIRFGVNFYGGISDGGGQDNLGFVANSTQRMLLTSSLFSSTVPVKLASYAVSGLPSAATAGAGSTAFVTDSSTTTTLGIGIAVIGGGANKVPVYSDGANWIIG